MANTARNKENVHVKEVLVHASLIKPIQRLVLIATNKHYQDRCHKPLGQFFILM